MECSKGDSCNFSHNLWEQLAHPQFYRTPLGSNEAILKKCIERVFSAYLKELTEYEYVIQAMRFLEEMLVDPKSQTLDSKGKDEEYKTEGGSSSANDEGEDDVTKAAIIQETPSKKLMKPRMG